MSTELQSGTWLERTKPRNVCEALTATRGTNVLRASQSIPLHIAEGNGKGTNDERRRFFEIARGSALECGSIQDCLEAGNVLTAVENAHGKTMSIRIVAMLTKLGQRSHEVRENMGRHDNLDYDYDNGAKGIP